MGDGMKKLLLYGGLVAGAVAGYYVLKLAIGDEPPIRVRGGSLEAFVEPTSPPRDSEWVSQGSNKWKLDSWEYNLKGEYVVRMKQTGGDCRGNIPGLAKHVKVTHHEQEFTLIHDKFQTLLTTKNGATKKNDKLIRHDGAEGQFVTALWVQGLGAGPPFTCTFTSAGQFEWICLCEDQQECDAICK